jgi:hypothetical protein
VCTKYVPTDTTPVIHEQPEEEAEDAPIPDCGNGIVEPDKNEKCDCGSRDCSVVDPCCDGQTCNFIAGGECSAADSENKCCDARTCKFKPSTYVCASVADECAGQPSKCSGDAPTCPPMNTKTNGDECTDGNNAQCFCHGQKCRSQDGLCREMNNMYYGSWSIGTCGKWWSTNGVCGQPICYDGDSRKCYRLSSSKINTDWVPYGKTYNNHKVCLDGIAKDRAAGGNAQILSDEVATGVGDEGVDAERGKDMGKFEDDIVHCTGDDKRPECQPKSPDDTEEEGGNAGVIAGAVIGVIGVLAIVGGVFFFRRTRMAPGAAAGGPTQNAL